MMARYHHMQITDNYITVDRNQIDVYEAIQWVKKTCKTYVTNQYTASDTNYDFINFYFLDHHEAKKEMSWFILRWS